MAESTAPEGDFWFERRHGGFRNWSDADSGQGAFRSTSCRESDDQQELEWAALEKLPTNHRLHTVILDSEGGSLASRGAINARRLGEGQRSILVEKALATSEQDNERFLSKVKERLLRVGLQLPSVEVRFEDLCVNADVHVGNRALPSLTNFTRNIVEGFLSHFGISPKIKRDFPILHALSGVIRPCRMTLLLGPPGAGKSTLLLALAGKLDKSLRTSGRITYNGHTFDEFIPQRTSSYISQTDNHIGELTVRETLDFAVRCQGVGYKQDMLMELARREKEYHIRPDPDIDAYMKATAVEGKRHSPATDYIMKILGLEICADTVVGNEMLRGISGGQKKRVTTGEMVVGPKKTLFMDEISTGLDSSTTYQIVKCTRNFVHLMDGTVFMALLQPAPETFELFDDICVLAEGHIVYLGPREDVLGFFEAVGFKIPPRKGVADFLQEVTSKMDQEQYWYDHGKPYRYIPVAELANAFREYRVGRELDLKLSTPFDKSKSHPASLVATKFALSKWNIFKACMEREYLLIKRNRFLYIFRTCQVAFVAILASTLFIRTKLHPTNEIYGTLYLSTLFFSLVHMMFNGFSEMSITVARLPVLYKQRDNFFYPGWAFSVPSWILRIPYSVVEAVIWSCLLYYTVGLTPEAGRFFRYMILLFLMHQMAIGLFRLLGALGRTMVVANTFGSFALCVVFVLGGFVLSKDNIHPWWIWGYWISPLSYAQNAIAVNEFLAPRWQKISEITGRPLYLSLLQSRGIFTRWYWYWIGFAALIVYIVVFNVLAILALQHLNPLDKPQATVAEDTIKEKVEGRTLATKRKSASIRDGYCVRNARLAEEVQMEDLYSVEHNGAPSQTAVVVANHKKESQGQKGMVLPFKPLALTFHNVNYYVDMPSNMKDEGVIADKLQLVRNVSGAFRPGVLTALMGVSGAGKTTLMDVLAGRKTGGYIEGDIRISGYPKVQKTFARIAGYVEQTDIHSPQLTVHESLTYSSWLRLPKDVDAITRETFVEEVMELVELNILRESLVGLPGTTGLSTEQRKRLTIAIELVANPSIIFMDEPTSGLDARAAAIVMRAIRNTVDTGRTVVCTIHQPSIDIFEAFDELLLLKRGGQTVYAGPLGVESKILVEYFQAIEGTPPIQEGYNPATWMLEVTTTGAELRIGKKFEDIYRESNLFLINDETIKMLSVPKPGSHDLKFPTTFSLSSWTQFRACLWKQKLSYWRSPYYNAVRFFVTAICALIFGSVFWKLGSKRRTQQDIFNLMGAMYAAVLFLGVNNASGVQPVVSVERSVFYRERAAGMYAALPYAFAQGLIEIPYILVQTLIYGLITYSMIQFEWTAVGLTSSQQLAAVVSSAFYSIWNLFSGFLIPRPSMPVWWSWYYYLSPVAWTLYGLIVSQLGDITTIIEAPGFDNVTVKDYLESYLGYRHSMVGFCAAVLIGFNAAFWLVFAFSIKWFNFQRR
ncbi:ABC transporter G family member 31 isoform X2 [Physcomitrium patens]|uniref:ABC transporter domain-containing protein n=1 Tax=Physcomitrium patens TaxID=3218 RepID=A0A2K1J0T5_PHYPA|nr:ABC transporter G family member 31-like isoform X2 [Physcomitrium patens]PNR35138.1 hypothetical protein PHYPA_023037 [Physcomitrium patens]|eukprot:XP_024402862.1 ABC transporter G family member 31-like isoform X2 [Physcomitrella patens]